jgi:hypothetical protein
VGSLNLKVTASDGSNATAGSSFKLTVSNVNDVPTVATALSDQTTLEDAAFSFQVPASTFADVDTGDTLTYTATRSDGTLAAELAGIRRNHPHLQRYAGECRCGLTESQGHGQLTAAVPRLAAASS